MKFLKRLLILIFILMLLVLGIIGAGAVNPDLSKKIAEMLYPGSTQFTTENASESSNKAMDDVSGLERSLKDELEDSDAEDDAGKTDSEAADGSATLDSSDNAGIEAPESDYEAPSEEDLQVPSDVAGKNGYEEITDSGHEATDKEAKQIEDELSCGETGDDLDFDELFYPYYHMLDDSGKHLYRQICANAAALNDRFKPVETCTSKKLKNVFEAVVGDHPELFWLDTGFSSITKGNGQVVEMDLKFNQTANNISEAQSKFDAAANEILSGAESLASDFDKEKYVHDALVSKIDYNLSAPMNQSAYSALVLNSTVCAGYARSMQYLMQKLNVPCYYCTGYAGQNHAWNIIKLDDDFYNVDVTWDDSSEGNYDYFNKTDSEFSKNHVRKNLSVYLPVCNGTNYQVATDPDASLRSLEDAGFSEGDVLYSMSDYYNDCYNKIVNNGIGNYSFSNVISGEDLLNTWKQEHSNKAYQSAYLDSAMDAIGAQNCQMNLSAEKLKGDKYLITHNVRIK